MKLTDYSFGENMLLALNEHRSGGVCVLLKIDPSGEAEEIASYENGIVSMDAGNKHISVLTDTGLFIYDTKKFEMTAYYEVSACLKVLMYEDGIAAAASRNSAAVYSVKNDEASNRKGK